MCWLMNMYIAVGKSSWNIEMIFIEKNMKRLSNNYGQQLTWLSAIWLCIWQNEQHLSIANIDTIIATFIQFN